ncbi:MAG: orotidine-5'-phosphate decarboxylase [Nitrospirae bacterium]|nr:orotidine-5'-phosphate decarboxylase [Nitrospirota bacterium]
MSVSEKVILALDVSEYTYAIELVEKFKDYVEIYKIGPELFISSGPKIIHDINNKGKKIFLDLKFHDIPNTVSKSAVVATKLGVYMFNVHISGGLEMMRKCRDAVVELCLKENLNRPKILGVTILTSISKDILTNELGIPYSIRTHVKHLSSLALKAGLDGVISSPREAAIIRNHCGKGFLIVTPGIRPSWTPPDDQKRTMTPKEAIREGADYLVMGRAVLQHPDPIKAIEIINLEILTA